MANQLFAGFVYTGAGVAVVGATVDLLDRNTTTPILATTTTNASGYWTISHATEGRFDVRITNSSSVTFLKYDDQLQIEGLEVAILRVRNPADTFDYDIVAAAITADRQLNLPLITATDTLAVLDLAQTFTNKKVTPMVVSATSITTSVAINADITDIHVVTAQAEAILYSNPTGTLVQGQKLIIRIKDNATARAITWGANFRAMGTALPTTTVVSKTKYLGFIYNSTDTKWDLIAAADEA